MIPTTPRLLAAGLALLCGLGGAEAATHHPRQFLRHHDRRAAPNSVQAPGPTPDVLEHGGRDQFGYPDDDPERPWGANNTITAPLGSEAAQEQENNRRYFCNVTPEHC